MASIPARVEVWHTRRTVSKSYCLDLVGVMATVLTNDPHASADYSPQGFPLLRYSFFSPDTGIRASKLLCHVIGVFVVALNQDLLDFTRIGMLRESDGSSSKNDDASDLGYRQSLANKLSGYVAAASGDDELHLSLDSQGRWDRH